MTDLDLEGHRVALAGYCYRMLGSAFEADDAVQETLIRAWRHQDQFEGRASLRTWLYRIATNVCLDMLRGTQRRARPMDLEEPSSANRPLSPATDGRGWIAPVPDRHVVPDSDDPADAIVARESIRLAFVAVLQQLPPRQRAVLILREVLRWPANEVAELLDTTVVSVNSMLQRARATLAANEASPTDLSDSLDDAQRALLARYVDAFERYDLDRLTALLHEEATMNMPPFPMWLRGVTDVRAWLLGPGAECRGSRLVPTVANGCPAFGQYRSAGPGAGHAPWALQVLDISGGQIVGITYFLDTAELFPRFGLPMRLAPVPVPR